jgi:hypothetical protein
MHELKQFFRSRWVELLIAGVWLQSVISAAFSGSLALLAITTLGGLVLLAIIFWLVGRFRRPPPPEYGDSEAFDTPRQALVFTVGRQKDSVLFALAAQQPAWLGLVCSRETEEVADEILAYSRLPGRCVQKEIVDPWSVVEVREKTAFILDWLARHELAPDDIAVDITGGTAIMSAAAFSMCAERQTDSQYIRSEYDQDNKLIPGTQRGVFVARYHQPPVDQS